MPLLEVDLVVAPPPSKMTARETLAKLFPSHGEHSVARKMVVTKRKGGVVVAVAIECSCGKSLAVYERDAYAIGWDLEDVQAGLRNAPSQ